MKTLDFYYDPSLTEVWFFSFDVVYLVSRLMCVSVSQSSAQEESDSECQDDDKTRDEKQMGGFV